MTIEKCDLVIRHERELGEVSSNLSDIKSDVSDIKSKVYDGLSTQVDGIEKEQIRLRGEDWLGCIVKGSVTKIIGLVVTIIILNALTNNGLSFLIKEKITKEPEQQKQILEKLDIVKDTVINTFPVVLTTEDIQAVKDQFIKEIKLEFDRQAKLNKFKGDTGKAGPVGQPGKEGKEGKGFWKK